MLTFRDLKVVRLAKRITEITGFMESSYYCVTTEDSFEAQMRCGGVATRVKTSFALDGRGVDVESSGNVSLIQQERA